MQQKDLYSEKSKGHDIHNKRFLIQLEIYGPLPRRVLALYSIGTLPATLRKTLIRSFLLTHWRLSTFFWAVAFLYTGASPNRDLFYYIENVTLI